MQYRCGPETTPKEMSALWSEPFSVKPGMGFYSYVDPVVLRTTNSPDDEDQTTHEAKTRAVFTKFFCDKDYVEK